MRRVAARLFVLALFTVFAGSARAQGGIALNWDGCLLDGSVYDKDFACNTNSGLPFVLYVSVVVPSDMPKFAAASAVVDVWFSGAAPPPWWQTNTGECRAYAIRMSFDSPALVTSCPDLWSGVPNLSVFQIQPGRFGAHDQLTLNGGAAIPAGQEIAVVADGTELTVCRITLLRAKSTGAGACAGCSACVTMLPVECWLQQPDPLPTYRVPQWLDERVGFRYWNCSPVATRGRSWGQIKSLYR